MGHASEGVGHICVMRSGIARDTFSGCGMPTLSEPLRVEAKRGSQDCFRTNR
jgi:hypothetical protein